MREPRRITAEDLRLVSACAAAMLADDAALRSIDDAAVRELPELADDDATLAHAIRLSNGSNVRHWLRSLARDPAVPVPPNRSSDVVDPVVDVARRGLEHEALDAYRTGQRVLLDAWIAAAFATAATPERVQAIVEHGSRSLDAFVRATVATLVTALDEHRDELHHGQTAQRLRTVGLVLDGAPIADDRVARVLRYRLDGTHGAAVVWSGLPDRMQRWTEDALQRAGARRWLVLPATRSTAWAWWTDAADATPARVADVLGRDPRVRIAIGAAGRGREGFVDAHRQALATQRLMEDAPHAPAVVTFGEVEGVALATRDRDAARAFVERTLGPLLDEPDDVRETLRLFLRHQSSATATARVVHAHRNTVLARVERARSALPATARDHHLHQELALEVARWLPSN
ncbi:MAG: helix-turn-helix domain-containing protein [Solirubrobacteraceae bacterium]|nr:helix-turn-helix domain-containing protein [Solirubrobacteraceae bacterium]